MSVSIFGGKSKNLLELSRDDFIKSISNCKDFDIVGNILNVFTPSFLVDVFNDNRLSGYVIANILFTGNINASLVSDILNSSNFNRMDELMNSVLTNFKSYKFVNTNYTLDKVVSSGTGDVSFDNGTFYVEDPNGSAIGYFDWNVNINVSGYNTVLLKFNLDSNEPSKPSVGVIGNGYSTGYPNSIIVNTDLYYIFTLNSDTVDKVEIRVSVTNESIWVKINDLELALANLRNISSSTTATVYPASSSSSSSVS